MAFTHLHVHTEYSLLDGACRIPKLVTRAKELGMDSLAITDHGVMFGAVDFWKECRKQGIKPIIGCEVYMAERSHLQKDPELDRRRFHLILLAKTNAGYRNLIKIVSEGCIHGMYYKPRVDHEVLRKYNGDILCLSGCLAGKIQRCLADGDEEGAREEAIRLRDIFGEGNFYLEIQDQGLEEERRINPQLIRMSKELGIPLAATNDVHYIRQEDSEAHDVLLAIQTATSVNDPKRMRFANDQFYLKSEKEMRDIFTYCPEAVDNTQKIADQCEVNFTFGEYHLPKFDPPAGMTNPQYLRKLCNDGLRERYDPVTPELEQRLDYELSTIEQMGYVEYFLIVWDFINYAKSSGIAVGPGRGSAAGSIVAYCLHITELDPIRYNLIFERFLNPERVSMPDIDVDFCIERRGEVIEYVKRKYGADHVSQIITFGTMKAKGAVRDVGRALDLTYAEADRIAKAIPFDLNMTLDRALEVSPELKKMYEGDDRVRKVIDMAKALEGMPRNASTHAAGVVISRLPVDEYVPLYLTDRGPATQFNMTTIEELGLLKMDFLGLRNLTVIRDALSMISDDYGVDVDFSKMTYDDPAVFKRIASGDTDGIFQLESEGMTSFMKNLKPSSFEDIVAGISLYRPGPMDSIPKYIENKKDPSKIHYVTPQLAHILDVTYGCLVYQEQVMQIVRDLAGYSYGRSDLVRRAMSKKKQAVMMEEKQYFIHGKLDEEGNVEIPGCIRNGISESAAEQIFADMVTFAQYAFNKSHAAAYAVVAYKTAWLKCCYPREFMAALLSSIMDNAKQTARYIHNIRERGIEVLPPSVNESGLKYTVEDGKIRCGLLAVKNVGENVIREIIRARESKGIPSDIFEFIRNLDVSQVNRKAIESLIKAGALDCLSPNRAAMLSVYEELLDSAGKDAKRNVAGQLSLFQMAGDQMRTGDTAAQLPKIADFEPKVRLGFEKEMLGFYMTGHPLDPYREILEKLTTITSQDLAGLGGESEEPEEGAISEEGFNAPNVFHGGEATLQGGSGKQRVFDGMRVTVGGMIASKRNLLTKKQQVMAFADLEDLYGQIRVVIFPTVYERWQQNVREDRAVIVRGRLSFREGEDPSVLADSVVDIDDEARVIREAEGSLKIRIPRDSDERGLLRQIQGEIGAHPGHVQVRIYLQSGKAVKTGPGAGADGSDALLDALCRLVGPANVKFH